LPIPDTAGEIRTDIPELVASRGELDDLQIALARPALNREIDGGRP